MNKLLLCMVLTGWHLAIMAQDRSADRAALRDIMSTIQTAINDRDLSAIQPILTDDAQLTFLNGEMARGFQAIQEYYDRVLGKAGAVLTGYTTVAEPNPAQFYGDTAVATGRTRDRFEFATGNTLELTTLWSATLVKRDDRWLLAGLHFSTDLFRNPLLNAAKAWLWWAFFAGVAGGVLLCFLLSRAWRKWRA